MHNTDSRHVVKGPQKYTKYILTVKREMDQSTTTMETEILIHSSHLLRVKWGKKTQQNGEQKATGYTYSYGYKRQHAFSQTYTEFMQKSTVH